MKGVINNIGEIQVQHDNQLYPVFLKLDQVKTLLVGAGNVGLEKLRSLLLNSPNAAITIVAPHVRDEVATFVSSYPNCTIIQRSFEEADLDAKTLVICATDDNNLHKKIKELAERRDILVNVADTPDLCDFYLGSIVQKGSLKIAVSTNGKSPTIAKRLKELFDDVIPAEMEELLDNLQKIRQGMKGNFQEKVQRLNEITKELANQNYEG